MDHRWRRLAPLRRDEEIRTLECRGCGLRQVVSVVRANGADGVSLSGVLLDIYPDCDALQVAMVMET